MFKKRMIPKIIHQMAPKNKELWNFVWDNCHLSWKEKFPINEYEHIMWNDEKIDNFIESEFPEYINFYYSLPFHILQLDFARFCILYKYGGIYADMDYYCFENFYDDLDKTLMFVESASNVGDEMLQNSLMCSEKNNFILKKIIEKCVETFYYYEIIDDFMHKSQNFYVRMICGPVLLTQYYNSMGDNIEKVGILKKELYNPDVDCIESTSRIKTFHFLTGMWGKDARKLMFRFIQKNENFKSHYYESWKKMRPKQYQKFSHLFE